MSLADQAASVALSLLWLLTLPGSALGPGSGGVVAVREGVRGAGGGERRVGPRLVEVDVGDPEVDVVLPLQAGQDLLHHLRQGVEVGPSFWLRGPALKHHREPAGGSRVQARVNATWLA